MKRDCGEGNLIPHDYLIQWYPDKGEREKKQKFAQLGDALEFFNELKLGVFGDARLYVRDKKGYANCILSKACKEDGSVVEQTNRLAELEQ